MMKLGDAVEVKTFTIGDYFISKVWLTKWNPTGHYQVLGLCRDSEGICHGYWTLWDTEVLSKAKLYIKELQGNS